MNTNILAIRIAFFLLTKYCQHKPSITFLGILIESYFGQEVNCLTLRFAWCMQRHHETLMVRIIAFY